MRLSAALLSPFLFTTPSLAADALPQPEPLPPSEISTALPFYVVGRIGGIGGDDTSFGTLGTRVSTDYEIGFTGSAALGKKMLEGDVFSVRLEAEVGFDRFGVDGHGVLGVGSFAGGDAFGEVRTFYGMANGFADVQLGAFTPYVGVGAGYAAVEFDGFGTSATGLVLDDDASGFAWQVGAGTAYGLNETTELELGYWYKGVEDVEVDAADGTPNQIDLRGHSITLGVRAKF